MIRSTRRTLTILATFALVAGCESDTVLVAVDRFRASLSGDKVLPTPVTNTGSGSFTMTLTSTSDSVLVDLTWSGLRASATNAHIHGPAADTATAGVLVDLDSLAVDGQGTFTPGTAGSATGWFFVSDLITPAVTGDSLFKLMHAGLLYVDIHTTSQTDAEVRGQIRKR